MNDSGLSTLAPELAEQLSPCPRYWRAVSSRDDALPRHRLAPFELIGTPIESLGRIRRVIEELPRSEIVCMTDRYLRATVRSRAFRFIDDLEFCYNPLQDVIHFRSVAQQGMLWDFGVNRARMKVIRSRYLDGKATNAE